MECYGRRPILTRSLPKIFILAPFERYVEIRILVRMVGNNGVRGIAALGQDEPIRPQLQQALSIILAFPEAQLHTRYGVMNLLGSNAIKRCTNRMLQMGHSCHQIRIGAQHALQHASKQKVSGRRRGVNNQYVQAGEPGFDFL